MLEDYLCSHETKLEVLSRKELTMLQNNLCNTYIYRLLIFHISIDTKQVKQQFTLISLCGLLHQMMTLKWPSLYYVSILRSCIHPRFIRSNKVNA